MRCACTHTHTHPPPEYSDKIPESQGNSKKSSKLPDWKNKLYTIKKKKKLISDNLTTQVVEENGITSTHRQKSVTQESCTQTRDLSFACQDEKKLLMYLSYLGKTTETAYEWE